MQRETLAVQLFTTLQREALAVKLFTTLHREALAIQLFTTLQEVMSHTRRLFTTLQREALEIQHFAMLQREKSQEKGNDEQRTRSTQYSFSPCCKEKRYHKQYSWSPGYKERYHTYCSFVLPRCKENKINSIQLFTMLQREECCKENTML